MRSGPRAVVLVAAIAAAVPVIINAVSGQVSASPEIQLQIADLLFSEERYQDALEAYERAQNRATDNQVVRAKRGAVRALLNMARFAPARREAEVLRELAPEDPETIALFGDALWSAGLFAEAEAAFRETLELNPESPRGRHGLAKALLTRSDLDGAMAEAQEALRLSPRVGEFHHTVGTIYKRRRQYDEAAVAFGNYVNLLPNKDLSERAAWTRSQVRFLRSFAGLVPLEMEAESSAKLYTVPFRLERDKIIVSAKVNDSREMDFVVDTGAEQTVLSREVARRVGVRPLVVTLSAGVGEIGLRGLQLGRIDTFEVGNMEIRNVPVLIKNPPLEDLPRRERESFSPLALGLSMRIDYERLQLTIGRHLTEEPFDVELPLRVHRLATVRGVVNGAHQASFVVDTGGEVISISSETVQSLERRPVVRHIPLRVYGNSGWDRDAFLLPGIDLAFSSIRFPNYPVVVLNLRAPSALLGFDVGGIIGQNFLGRYRVNIDLESSSLRLRELGTS